MSYQTNYIPSTARTIGVESGYVEVTSAQRPGLAFITATSRPSVHSRSPYFQRTIRGNDRLPVCLPLIVSSIRTSSNANLSARVWHVCVSRCPRRSDTFCRNVFQTQNPNDCFIFRSFLSLPSLSVSVSISRSASVCLSACLPVCLPAFLSVYLSDSRCLCPSVSLCQSLSLSICLCLCFCLSVCLSASLSVCLFFHSLSHSYTHTPSLSDLIWLMR